MIKNIFLTGLPCLGKTSLIKEIIEVVKGKKGGFYTSEIKEGNRRIGFEIKNLKGKSGLLAHVNFKSSYRVGKYRVNLKDLEEIGIRSILEAIKECDIVVIDEIGKMELLLRQFKEIVWKALESNKKIIGTIKLKDDFFTVKIKGRKDTKIFQLTKMNREEIKTEILNLLSDS